MEPFISLQGKAAVLNRINVDTDQIIPKQFLKRVERTGFGQYLFFDWRFRQDGSENESFELNRPENKAASVLIAGKNFGCGSSREHAPWALLDYGFKVIIAPSFADIFYNNCLKNGILPIAMDEDQVQQLMNKVEKGQRLLTVDLEQQTITDEEGAAIHFSVDPYWKDMLLNGKDEIDVTLDYESLIEAYEQRVG